LRFVLVFKVKPILGERSVIHGKALLPLLYSAGGALFVTAVLVPLLAYEEIMSDVSSWSSFFTVFGVIYAIFVGFLLAAVLTRYGTLTQAIDRS
jgi:uncharacterized protein involved in response to NO